MTSAGRAGEPFDRATARRWIIPLPPRIGRGRRESRTLPAEAIRHGCGRLRQNAARGAKCNAPSAARRRASHLATAAIGSAERMQPTVATAVSPGPEHASEQGRDGWRIASAECERGRGWFGTADAWLFSRRGIPVPDRHQVLTRRLGSSTSSGRAVALPLTRTPMAGRSCRVGGPSRLVFPLPPRRFRHHARTPDSPPGLGNGLADGGDLTRARVLRYFCSLAASRLDHG